MQRVKRLTLIGSTWVVALTWMVSSLRADLVAHWKLDEGSGSVFADSAGGGNDGFLPGGGLPEWSDDAAPTGFNNPYSLRFDPGLLTYVDTPFEGVGGFEPRTISAWVKTDSTAGQAIVAYGARDGNGRKWHFRVNPDGAPRVPGAVRTEAQGGNQTGDMSVADGEWHHVVSVFPSVIGDNDEVMHYVDGVLQGTTGTTDEPIDTGIGGNFPLVTIGARQQSPPAFENFFDGLIDDVRIYDRELSEAEIVGLATAPTTDGLVAHWPFDEGPGNLTTADLAGGNDGALTGAAGASIEWVQDGPPGIQDVSVEFTGDLGPSYIETPFEGIGGSDPRTITLWVKADPPPGHSAMVAWGSLDNGRKWHFRIDQTSGNALRTEFAGGQNFAETDLADGEWHFVASVFPDDGFEGADVLHYLDGEFDFQFGGTSIDIDTAIDPDEGAFPVHIGFAAGHAGRFFVGQMADVRIYDEALDEEALRAIMAGEGLETRLQPGDANMDLEFNQLDIVQVQISAKYLTGEAATWGEGDWDGAPGGEPGNPPPGDGTFNQLDIVAALGAGKYLTGPYGALSGGGGVRGDGQTSIVYDANTGEVAVDAPAGAQLTSINIDSAAGIFTGDPADNLGGSFDNDADENIFKATFGSSFGSISFGTAAQIGLSEEFVTNDLTVVGSLDGGGALGEVDLIYIPEPSSVFLMVLGAVSLLARRTRRPKN